MCVAAFAINASGRWPLVLASNRDEFFDRPALPLSLWPTAAGQTIVSGRDVTAGGTWLGMTPGGRVALLTNVREGVQVPAALSRGELVVRWLESTDRAAVFTARIDGGLYGGFNLVMGDLQSGLWHSWSNRPAGLGGADLRVLTDGIYGLSNAALDTPWPKTVALRTALAQALLASDQNTLEKKMWQALGSKERAELPDLPQTGVANDLEWALSSAHVDLPERNYGTRCSSLMVVGTSGHQSPLDRQNWAVSFKERTFLPGAQNTIVDPVVCSFDVRIHHAN